MKLQISNVPIGVRHISPLHHSKIVVKSLPWDVAKFSLTEINQSILWKMITTCLLDDGIGIAAPQVGLFKRMFIIRDLDDHGQPLETFTAYFNPSFTSLAKDKVEAPEGCLSVPGSAYSVPRYTDILATWWELTDAGTLEKKQSIMTGYLARVFQHENDHLNGVSIVKRGTKTTV